MKVLNIALLCFCIVVTTVTTLEDALEVGDGQLSEEGSVDGGSPQGSHYHLSEAVMWYDATTTSDSDVSDTDFDSEALSDTSSSDDDFMYDDYSCDYSHDEYGNDDHRLEDVDTSDSSDVDSEEEFQPIYLQ